MGKSKDTKTSKVKAQAPVVSKKSAKEVVAKAAPSKKSKKAAPPSESSDSDSESAESAASSESESEAEVEVEKTNGAAKKEVATSDSSDSSSESEDGSSDSDSDDSKPAAATEESDSDDSSDSEEEAAPAKDAKVAKATSGSDSSDSDEEDSDDSEEEESTEEAAPSKKRKADDEEETAAKKSKTEVEDTGSKNLFVGNLSWNIDDEWLYREFEEFGEITGARVISDRESGRSKGFGYVEFANSADAAAALKAKKGALIDGREANVDFSTPRDNAAPKDRANARAQTYGDAKNPESDTLFVGNISFEANEDMLGEAFGAHGTVVNVRLPTDM
ncbi:hypothetical protein VC83_04140 [Pseudogymnoascus destructans]|nr:uncharacterized protein VC83_04140 [Pseudogymnoascus destructans]OAF59345.2 hypothetical protein VC83_04140 [Pseudogymnoascus destructans]